MRKVHILAAIAVWSLLGQAAAATQYVYSIQGTVVAAGGSTTVFGESAPSFQLSQSLVIDDTTATFVAAGTIFDTDNSFAMSDDAYLIVGVGVVGTNLPIGNATFDVSDLVTQPLGELTMFKVLVTGTIAAPTGFYFLASDASLGEFSLGQLTCPTTTCFLAPAGTATSYQDGGFAEISNVSVTVAPASGAVPEPMTWMMMIVGFGMVGQALRLRKSHGSLLTAR